MRYDLWSMLRKFGPFAILIGYVGMYYSTPKGLPSLIPDLQAITIAKLTSKWQNFAIAAAAGVGITLLHKIKLPASLKTIVTIILYLLIGWQIATAIDPPGSRGVLSISTPRAANPYALQIKGG